MAQSRVIKNAVFVIAFALAAIVGMEFLAINIGQPSPFGSGLSVKAVFSDANGIPTAADVRVAGVSVGKVTAIQHDPRLPNDTVVVMQINDSTVVMHGNASATVRPKTLLGEKYVDLDPGNDAGGPLPEQTILSDSTSKSVENDEIFNAFDKKTRDEQKQVLQDLDRATTGRAGDIQAILPQLQQVVADLTPLAQTYERDNPHVDNIFVNLNTMMQALADEHQQLAGLLSNGNIALGAIAQKDSSLIGTLQEASNVATEFNAAAAPTITAQRQALQRLAPTLDSLHNFLDAVSGNHCNNDTAPCGIDKVFTGTLLGQLNYPSDQLSTTSSAGELVALEYNSMFSYPATGYQTSPANPGSKSAPSHSSLNLTLSIQCDTLLKETNGATLLQNLSAVPGLAQLIQQECGNQH